jgi:hypothetical protein
MTGPSANKHVFEMNLRHTPACPRGQVFSGFVTHGRIKERRERTKGGMTWKENASDGMSRPAWQEKFRILNGINKIKIKNQSGKSRAKTKSIRKGRVSTYAK